MVEFEKSHLEKMIPSGCKSKFERHLQISSSSKDLKSKNMNIITNMLCPRLDRNIEAKSLNNSYLNIIEIFNKLNYPFFEMDVTTKIRDSMIFKFYLCI